MTKKFLPGIFFVFCLLVVALSPTPLLAQGGSSLIPCTGGEGDECTYSDLIQLGNNILTFLVLLSIPLATIAFAWAGVLMLTAQGKEEQVSEAKNIFSKVLMGFLFVLTAWLIVELLTSALLKPDFYNNVLRTSVVQSQVYALERSAGLIEFNMN